MNYEQASEKILSANLLTREIRDLEYALKKIDEVGIRVELVNINQWPDVNNSVEQELKFQLNQKIQALKQEIISLLNQ